MGQVSSQKFQLFKVETVNKGVQVVKKDQKIVNVVCERPPTFFSARLKLTRRAEHFQFGWDFFQSKQQSSEFSNFEIQNHNKCKSYGKPQRFVGWSARPLFSSSHVWNPFCQFQMLCHHQTLCNALFHQHNWFYGITFITIQTSSLTS